MTIQTSINIKTTKYFKPFIHFKAIIILLILSIIVLQLVPVGLNVSETSAEMTSNRPISILHYNSNEIEKAAIRVRVKGLTPFLYLSTLVNGLVFVADPIDFTAVVKFLDPLILDCRLLMKKNIMSLTNGNNFK